LDYLRGARHLCGPRETRCGLAREKTYFFAIVAKIIRIFVATTRQIMQHGAVWYLADLAKSADGTGANPGLYEARETGFGRSRN
jgi:hypothetical protein